MSTTESRGTILSIKGLVIHVRFNEKDLADVGTLLFCTKHKDVKLLVLSQESENSLVALNVSNFEGLAIGDEITQTGEYLTVPVGKEVLGRVFNALGEPIDNLPALPSAQRIEVKTYKRKEKNLDEGNNTVIETGIKVIDFFAPFVKGRKIGVIGGAGVGKTVLVTELMHNVSARQTGVSFFVGIGERIREAHELYDGLKNQKLLENTVMYLGQMNESAALRSSVGMSAATVARWWRDEKKKDVLFFVDNIYRYLQAGNELATMLGEIPSEGGYQPTLFTDLLRFQEGLDSNQNGSITSVQSIYIPADDTSDPAVVEIYQQLDSVIVLSRSIMERGILPAVDLVATSSSLLSADMVGERHALLHERVAAIMQKYNELRNIIAIIGESELSLKDRADYQKAQHLVQYFTQPLFVTEPLTGKKGEYVSREDMLAGVEEILAGG